MFCIHCGVQVSENSAFCNKCGHKINPPLSLPKAPQHNISISSTSYPQPPQQKTAQQYYPQNPPAQQPAQQKQNKAVNKGVYCKKCGYQMQAQILPVNSRGSTKDKGALYDVGRETMKVATLGLWGLTGKKRTTTKTKFKYATMFVCPNCGYTR